MVIEKTILDYLTDALSVPVYMEEPTPLETDYVILEKTGSSDINKIPSATIAIQSYGGSLLDAATLNETVKAVMENIITLDSISAVRLNSDYNFTDTTTKRYRYQAIYVITYWR